MRSWRAGANTPAGHGNVIARRHPGRDRLPLSAREAGVPCYAVAQTHKIAPSGWPLALAPQEPADLARVGKARVTNIAFDATPLVWFTAVYTERGCIARSALSDIRRSLACPSNR
ncbi:MAG: hypothetical protein MUQ65_13325 [Armatimonadetes bacterium]|nr:hypothetical protein [Armatimonadota bacterium]